MKQKQTMKRQKTTNNKVQGIDGILSVMLRTKDSLLIIGPAGCGKSSSIHNFCLKNGLGFVDFRASIKDAGDLAMPLIDQGIQRTRFIPPATIPLFKEGDAEDKERVMLRFGLQNWRAQNPELADLSDEDILRREGGKDTLINYGRKGILFLDEINRANPLVIQALFQLVLDRRIDDYVLLPEWGIVAACNIGDEYLVQELDPAMLDRFTVIYFTGNEACDWLKNQYKLADRFLSERDLTFSQERITKQTTPRGLERSIKQLEIATKEFGLSDEEILRMLYGNIASGDANLLLDLYKKEKIYTWTDFYNDIAEGKIEASEVGVENFTSLTKWDEFRAFFSESQQKKDEVAQTLAKFIRALYDVGKREECHALFSSMLKEEKLTHTNSSISLEEFLSSLTHTVYQNDLLKPLRKIWRNLQAVASR